MAAAVNGGADMVGLVFFDRSPRAVAPETAAALLDGLPEDVRRVGLFVDPDDALLERVLGHVRLDIVQLHGSETPARCASIGRDWAVEIMKAIGVADAADIETADRFRESADWILFDARPPDGADRPGGHGRVFDWSLLNRVGWPGPWLLSGGLTPQNVQAAIAASKPYGLDVSSGVETAPGEKSPEKIRAFLAAVNP